MKISFQSSRYNGLSLIDEVSAAVAADVEYFDIFFDNFEPGDISNEELEFLILRKSSIFYSFHLPLDIISGGNLETRLRDIINLALELNVKHCTVHSGELLINQRASLYLITCMAERNIFLAVENATLGNGFISKINYIKHLENFLKYENISINFDTGHAKIAEGNPSVYLDFILKYLIGKGEDTMRLSALHLHTNDGQRDSHIPFCDSIPDARDELNTILKILKDISYKGLLIIEQWKNPAVEAELIRSIVSGIS